jgi:hypothetical protein
MVSGYKGTVNIRRPMVLFTLSTRPCSILGGVFPCTGNLRMQRVHVVASHFLDREGIASSMRIYHTTLFVVHIEWTSDLHFALINHNVST